MSTADTIVARLARAAECHPERCALQVDSQALRYDQLWSQVRRTANWLQQRGIQRGERVVLVLENSSAYVLLYYAVLLCGAVAVPLSGAARTREVLRAVAHSSARLVIAPESNAEVAAASALWAPGVALAGEPSFDAADQSFEGALPDLASDAVILYTSGTTGEPKGVLLSHGNLASNCTAIQQYLRLSHTDSTVCILPFHYTYGSSVLHSHLSAGARIVLQKNLVYPHLVVSALASECISGFSGVASTFALLLARVKLADYDLSALRYLTVAGGSLPPDLARALHDTLPHVQIFAMYGQTEATARISFLPPERLLERPGSAGLPVRDTRIEIRDSAGSVLGPMQEGSIWVSGPGVMSGYWNDAAATARVLRDGWLLTGDVGWLDAEGYLFIAGRRSDMIKVGSHRVHPAEVEEVLRELAPVAEALVSARPDELLGAVICATLVLQPGKLLSEESVRAHCRERLAPHKVPRTVTFASDLPRTASGKLRRTASNQE